MSRIDVSNDQYAPENMFDVNVIRELNVIRNSTPRWDAQENQMLSFRYVSRYRPYVGKYFEQAVLN